MYPFLTFPGNAADAIAFYLHALPGSALSAISYYPDSEKVLNAQLAFYNQSVLMMDLEDAPPFAWSTSLYVEAESEAEYHTLFDSLKRGGTVLMGPESAGIMKLVAWVTDPFGVTWQLVWPG